MLDAITPTEVGKLDGKLPSADAALLVKKRLEFEPEHAELYLRLSIPLLRRGKKKAVLAATLYEFALMCEAKQQNGEEPFKNKVLAVISCREAAMNGHVEAKEKMKGWDLWGEDELELWGLK